jgi:Ca-activated chloride channel family protein
LAIALPTADFQHHFGDGAGLVKAKLWQGSVITREALPRQQTVDSSKPTKHEIVPAAAESLVRQFHNKEKEPTNYPPVCGATPGRMQLPSVKDLPEATRSKQILAGDSVTIPSVSSAQARKPSTDNKAIKVEVSLVTVPVFVGNKDGNYLPGLKPSDFHVFEDNVEQKIDRLLPEGDPNNIALLIDTSDSMGWADGRPDGRPAAISSLVSLLRSDDRLMLVSFNDRIFVDAEFTNDHEQLVHAGTKAEIFPATRLYDAVDLVKTDRLDQVPGRKVMILITDGVDTRSRIADSVSTLKGVEEGNLLIYVIQCRADSNPAIVKGLPAGLVSPRTGWIPSFLNKALEGQENRYAGADKYLQNLSTGSGGELYFAAAPGDVKDILAHIADELGHEYTICYYPSNARSDASYHHLHVTVDVPGLQIRARQGYRAR